MDTGAQDVKQEPDFPIEKVRESLIAISQEEPINDLPPDQPSPSVINYKPGTTENSEKVEECRETLISISNAVSPDGEKKPSNDKI